MICIEDISNMDYNKDALLANIDNSTMALTWEVVKSPVNKDEAS